MKEAVEADGTVLDIFYRPPFPWWHFILQTAGDDLRAFDDLYERVPFVRLLSREEANRYQIEKAKAQAADD